MKTKKYTDTDLKTAIETSLSWRSAILKLGLNPNGGGNYSSLKKHAAVLSLDITNMLGQGWCKGKIPPCHKPAISLDKILIKNSPYRGPTDSLKKRLFKEGILIEKCAQCGMNNEWQGKPLALHIDHINGVRNDNSIENLRILCPNCHSQTPTYAGKGKKRSNKKPKMKQSKPPKTSHLCPEWRHRPKPNQRKVVRPSKEELEKMISEMPMVAIGKKYGVTDNAVRKWVKYYSRNI